MSKFLIFFLIAFQTGIWGSVHKNMYDDDIISLYQHALGGKWSHIKEHPFMVSLQKKVPLKAYFSMEFTHVHKCSGTIISKQWVLTSGTCVWDFGDRMIIDLTEHLIVAGASNCSIQNKRVSKYNIASVLLYPDYDPDDQTNDVGLIRINTKFNYTYHVYQVEIASHELLTKRILPIIFKNKTCITIGWSMRASLRTHHRTIISPDKCVRVFPDSSYGSMFFCSYDAVRSTCPDMGAPVVCDGVQVGISSQGCFKEGMSIWTKVDRYFDWIMGKVDPFSKLKKRNNTGMRTCFDVFILIWMFCWI